MADIRDYQEEILCHAENVISICERYEYNQKEIKQSNSKQASVLAAYPDDYFWKVWKSSSQICKIFGYSVGKEVATEKWVVYKVVDNENLQ